MTKTFYACNWAKSRITEEYLNRCVLTGALGNKENIHWQAPGTENPPQPKEGEVIVFTDHLLRGFNPPGSKFCRDVLSFFNFIHKT